jgi:hypothetical protein
MKPGTLKRLFPLLAFGFLGGCASSGPPLPPSLEVASPVTDLRALRKGDRVYLAWTEPTKTTDHELIRHPGPTLICRSRENVMKECGASVGQAPPAAVPEKIRSKKQAPAKTTAIYTDTLPVLAGVQPQDEITYAVEVMNDRNRSAGLSNQIQVPLMPAVRPPDGFKAELTAQGVKITWACPPPPPQFANVEYRLRILRRLAGSQTGGKITDEKIAEPTFTQPGQADCAGPPVLDTSFLDTSFEWEKTYDYRAAVVTVISEPTKSQPATSEGAKPPIEIEGDDTPSVTVVAHDVFPPAVPSDLQAVFSGPGQQPFVDLIWSPDTDADLAGYNVYRREDGGPITKLNSELVKTPAYRDGKVQSGKKYFYSISAVDVRGNESAKSVEASEEVP